MKDYTFTRKGQSKFIQSFREKGDVIEVYMADGLVRELANNETHRQALDDLMKDQIYNVRPNLYKISLGLSSLVALSSTYTIATLNTDNLVATGLLALSVGLASYLVKTDYDIIKDIDKHIFYLEMEDDINRNNMRNANLFSNVSPNSKKLIDTNGFGINIIEELPEIDLVTIDINLESKILVKRMEENDKLKNK